MVHNVSMVTVALAEALPPAPVQMMLYEALAVGETDWLPLVAVEVVQEAEHPVALIELQLNVDDSPAVMMLGFGVKETVGAAGATPASAFAAVRATASR